ncbi:MAG: endonuclease domain-containing protein [Bacteroidota bacterium]|nr:endonuclease domain-containing protein [Bacteroidota bacterium]
MDDKETDIVRITDLPFYYGAGIDLLKKAKDLRLDSTIAEKVLWGEIRNKRIEGARFRRQHPIKQFVADFYCKELNLVIEIDGGYHEIEEQKEYDDNRTFELNELGIQVIRFTNDEILNDLKVVGEKIRENVVKIRGNC